MKLKLLILSAFIVSVFYASAQHFKFSSFEDAIGQEVTIFDTSVYLLKNDNLYYRNEKGKFKKQKRDKIPVFDLNAPNILLVTDIVYDGEKRYLALKSSDDQMSYILLDKYASSDLLPKIVSYSVYKAGIEDIAEKYAFVCSDIFDFTNDPFSAKFIPVVWTGVRMGYTMNDDPVYSISIDGSVDKGTLKELSKKHNFISKDERLKQIKAEQKDSLKDFNPIRCNILSPEDRHPSVAFAYFISPKSNNMVCLVNDFEKKTYRLDDLAFDNKSDVDFLKRRGNKCTQLRFDIASKHDSISTRQFYVKLHQADSIKHIQDSLYIDSLRQEELKLKQFLANLKKKQIFIFEEDYSYGDFGQFGKKIQFYNCFDKTIKYIHLTFTAYNAVHDQQGDDIGRSTAKARCIGPMEPDELGTFDFDNLFWDERELLKYVYITQVTFEFTNGTTKTFKGSKQIDTHRLENVN